MSQLSLSSSGSEKSLTTPRVSFNSLLKDCQKRHSWADINTAWITALALSLPECHHVIWHYELTAKEIYVMLTEIWNIVRLYAYAPDYDMIERNDYELYYRHRTTENTKRVSFYRAKERSMGLQVQFSFTFVHPLSN